MENYYLFLFMCMVLIILPGPDTAIATKNTLTLGKSGGLQTMLGTCCALLIHTSAAILGLSAIVAKSAFLFSIFKYAGAIYLVYLGIKTLLSLRKKEEREGDEQKAEIQFEQTSCFKQGFLTNILNPKVAIFFLTFFPQFVDTGGNTFMPFLIMGITYAVLTALWFVFYIYLIHQVSAFMKKPKTQTFVEGLTGTVLIGFGLKLALEKGNH
ncbi:LysE family translocator [Lysinibacillus yapensis]|uniref:LysE family translocator n=1 Tax=Ureibacillus yapensis TaxID=2304605 RepID=A0A396S4S6_9BACL|nr:LysE family translocator [Lysinibacillus yapensis]RHW33961.1 LysE family translocator [Lysinibacillus yapensis]